MRLIYRRGAERIAFPIDEGETFIGRKDDCDIYFPDSSLSKRHARLVRRGGTLTAYDAGSKNGTLVNGEPIDGPTPLRSGDILQCGKLEFLVEGVGGADFEIVEEESTLRRGSRARSAVGSAARASAAPLAKAVRSGEVRGSVLDEFPEMPPSVEEAAPLAPAGPTARFRVVEGGQEQTWDLPTDRTITIGSKPENFVVLAGEGISRYHAEVVHEGEKWLLKDLGARNGLFVAGKKVDIHELVDGDEVQVGTVKLRFEVVKPSPLDEVKALLAAVQKDPVGTFKREPRVRIAAACLVAALCLLLMALPGGGGSGSGGGTSEDLGWVLEGTAKLEAGEYREAHGIFRKAQAKVPSHMQDIPRALTALANHWTELDQGPLRFRWGRAEELLMDCARLPNLPDSTRTWIDRQMGTVRLNKEAYDKLSEAEQTGAAAVQLASEKKLREALKRFELAILRYREVPPQSAFADRARDQERAIRGQAYRLVIEEVKALMRAPSPDWRGIVTFLGQANAYADTPEQRMELRMLKEQCETNRRDEELYQRAVDIVTIRDVENYPAAVRLLEQVDRRSRIYPDAQAYIQWIDADLKVRQAQRHYEMGDHERAFKLLNEALQYEVLGPEARASVRTRRQNWGRVVTAFQRGMDLFNDNRTKEAQEEFQRVIQLEPSRANTYHRRSLDQLRYIQQLESYSLERKLREGLDALQNNEFDKAFRFFGDVQKDPNKQARDLQRIQDAVANANRSRRLLHHAQQDFLRDRQERFLEIYYITKLLRRWLPPGDRSQRDDAEKLYQDVLKRLKVLQKISGIEDDDPPPANRRSR